MSLPDCGPCPFCGDAWPILADPYPKRYAITCDKCGAMGPFIVDEIGDPLQSQRNAIDAWNRRPQP